MGQIVFIALFLIGIGGFSIFTNIKNMQHLANDKSMDGKLKKGKIVISGFVGPSILILTGLLLLYVWYQSTTTRPFK